MKASSGLTFELARQVDTGLFDKIDRLLRRL
jgi:hypothetical protein